MRQPSLDPALCFGSSASLSSFLEITKLSSNKSYVVVGNTADKINEMFDKKKTC